MKPNEGQSNNVIKGGYFNVSTKPAEPIVNSLNNWGTASPLTTPIPEQPSQISQQPQSDQRQPASNT